MLKSSENEKQAKNHELLNANKCVSKVSLSIDCQSNEVATTAENVPMTANKIPSNINKCEIDISFYRFGSSCVRSRFCYFGLFVCLLFAVCYCFHWSNESDSVDVLSRRLFDRVSVVCVFLMTLCQQKFRSNRSVKRFKGILTVFVNENVIPANVFSLII